MLCLSRKVGEKILIGDDIVVQVLRAVDGRVRLGVTAPREIRVDREEIDEIKQAMKMGIPLHEIEEHMEWRDQCSPSR